MIFYRNVNSKPYNWLLHHHYIESIDRFKKYLKGRLLDVGCGQQPYRKVIGQYVTEYIGLEYPTTSCDSIMDVAGDGHDLPFVDDSFDTVVLFQVLEHVPEPSRVLQEVGRVLKPNGYVIITAPFIWHEHSEPHDYYRYTRYGLRYLGEKAGFEVIFVEPYAGFWTVVMLILNYYLLRVSKGFISVLMAPIFFMTQMAGFVLDSIDCKYSRHTLGFLMVMRERPDELSS